MKKVYITPRLFVQEVSVSSIIAASMFLSDHVVSDIDDLAVKNNDWEDIWDEDNYYN